MKRIRGTEKIIKQLIAEGLTKYQAMRSVVNVKKAIDDDTIYVEFNGIVNKEQVIKSGANNKDFPGEDLFASVWGWQGAFYGCEDCYHGEIYYEVKKNKFIKIVFE